MSDFEFIDIPRTGSTSLRTMLGLNDTPRHETIEMRADRVGWDRIDEAFVFTFVRNPWPRMVSLWSICDGRDGMGFLEFLRLRVVGDVTYRNPVVPDREYWPYIFQPQWGWISDRPFAVDAIYKFENYEENVRHVYKVLNLGQPEFKRAAQGTYDKKRGWKDYYCPESIAIVQEFYEEDFENFGYEGRFPSE